jgi:hypothetical protein
MLHCHSSRRIMQGSGYAEDEQGRFCSQRPEARHCLKVTPVGGFVEHQAELDTEVAEQ